jgi:hypothetical protein
MKIFWLALLALVIVAPAPARAKVPSQFAVQGVLRDGAGKLQSTMVNVTVTLWDAQTGGNKLAGPYGPFAVMATNGLFSVPIQDAMLQPELGGAAQVWVEVIVGNDTFARQLVTPQMFALMCGSADALAPTATVDGAQISGTVDAAKVSGNGGAITNLNGAALQAGSVPKAAVGAWTTHDHALSVTKTGNTFTPLNWGAATGGKPYTICSAACGNGTVVIGGDCFIQGDGCTGATGAPNVWLKESYSNQTNNTYCCTGVAAGGTGICNLNVVATCLGASTGSAL